MPLFMAKKGHRLQIKAIYGGRGLQARLSAMGLVLGMHIEVISNNQKGPLVIRVMGIRIILGRGMAQKMIVGGRLNFFHMKIRHALLSLVFQN